MKVHALLARLRPVTGLLRVLYRNRKPKLAIVASVAAFVRSFLH